jgi:WD40 repeat protein
MSKRAGRAVCFLLGCLGLGALVSCGPATAGPSHATVPEPDQKPSAPSSQDDAVSPGVVESIVQEASRPRSLISLPSDVDFLRAPLAKPVPDRYSSWREVERIEVGQSHLMEVDRLPSGRLLALSQAEGKVRVYERGKGLRARHESPGFQEFEPSALLAWPAAPDRYLQGTPRGVAVYDALTGTLIAQVDQAPVWRLRWSADGRVVMALGQGTEAGGSTLRFFGRTDGDKLEKLGELSFPQRVDAWDLSPDARLLALAQYPADRLVVLDLARGGEEIFRGPAPRYAGDVAFSPDGRFVAAGGDGLLLLDLANTHRRAFYSYVKNNIGHVRFSPSSDAVVMSSYDGKIRILGFGPDPSGALGLTLLKELSHAGNANVYAFVFSKDGSELVSASGDRTLRAFAGRKRPDDPNPAANEAPRSFHDLETWKKLDTITEPAPIVESELGPPRPSRIVPGHYACKITTLYKLRDCTVRRDARGHTRLEFAADNLLHLGGILWDDGPAVRFEGKLLSPSTVIECKGCEHHTLKAVFRGQNGRYTGLLTFRTYYDPRVPLPTPPLDVRIEEASDRFPLVLEYRGPLEARPVN